MRRATLSATVAGLLATALAAVGAPAFAQTPPQPAQGSISIRLADAPADRQNDPRARIAALSSRTSAARTRGSR